MRRMQKVRKKSNYVLIDAQSILKNVSAVPSFNTGIDHSMLRARIHIIPVVKRVLKVSSWRKRPTKTGETELLQQFKATDWAMAADIEEVTSTSLISYFSARKIAERAQPQ